jgi:hypothetical protein
MPTKKIIENKVVPGIAQGYWMKKFPGYGSEYERIS